MQKLEAPFSFKVVVDFQGFEFEDDMKEKTHTHTHKHTKFETKALNKKHVLIREDPDPFDEDICLKTFGFG